jgi:hypothetical protein
MRILTVAATLLGSPVSAGVQGAAGRTALPVSSRPYREVSR